MAFLSKRKEFSFRLNPSFPFFSVFSLHYYLDDLLSSLEESTTEMAFTTTEPEDDVCPKGFSHNAEMNVCDDLNEVSEKIIL